MQQLNNKCHIIRGVDNGAAGAAGGRGGGRRPNNLASRCFTEMMDFSPPKQFFFAFMNAI